MMSSIVEWPMCGARASKARDYSSASAINRMERTLSFLEALGVGPAASSFKGMCLCAEMLAPVCAGGQAVWV
jgi:hypothetical protein